MKKWFIGFGKGLGIIAFIVVIPTLFEFFILQRETGTEITTLDILMTYIATLGVFVFFKIRRLWIIPALILGILSIPFMMADRETMLVSK